MTRDDNEHLLLHALADGELDAATALTLEQKIAADATLAAEFERIRALKAVVGRLGRPHVSSDFNARIAALGRSAAAPIAPTRTPPLRRLSEIWNGAGRPGSNRQSNWQAMAASIVMTAFVASGATYLAVAPSAMLSTEDAIVNGHRRSLLASNPIDIASSDRHTVRPWFDAKLGVSPPTPDLAAEGFALVGGRVEIVDNRPVPSLVYRHNGHLITVVAVPVAPGNDVTRPAAASTAGAYNLVRWSRPGFSYWALSDLDAAELGTFVAALRAHGD